MGGVILTLTISIISILALTYLMKCEGLNLPLIVYAGPFPVWIIFFFMGLFLSNRNRDYGLLWPAAVCAAGFLLQIYEYRFWLDKGIFALGIKTSSFIFSIGVVWLLFSKKVEQVYTENFIVKSISWIGGISFGIYLLHCYIIICINKIMPDIAWAMRWFLVLSVTILVIWVAKKTFPKISEKYLGFR